MTCDSIQEIIIETYLYRLGFSDPHMVIGRRIGDQEIVGVFKDFHMNSLRFAIEPCIINSGTGNCFALTDQQLVQYNQIRSETNEQKEEFLNQNPAYIFTKYDNEMDF